MTLNVLWTDERDTKFLLCDSARTHTEEPRFSHSVLGQLQRNRKNAAVEEGAQKIIRLTDSAGAALCGSEYDALQFVRLAMNAYHTGDLVEFLACANSPPNVTTEISIAERGRPISVYQPHVRNILELSQGALSIRGSISDAIGELLATAIGKNLIERGQTFSAEEKLVHALGYATTIAAQFNLTDIGIGGSFFGATITEGAGFAWQPDILYVLYSPATIRAAFGDERVGNVDDHMRRVVAQIRDDVGISAAFGGGRIVLASSRSMTPDISTWLAKWPINELIDGFFKPQYFVFAPQTRGNTVIVKNTGTSVRFSDDTFDIRSDLMELLSTIPATEFRSVYLFPPPEEDC